MIENLTFVVIGKNEGLNLKRCFLSIQKISTNIIYIDSNSDDNSIEIAKNCSIENIYKVISDNGTPALSRSVGAEKVKTKYIQFVDGDMEIEKNWPLKAIDKIINNKRIAAVHGYKKVYTKNTEDYFILSDSKDWQADYLQGAFLISKEIYLKSGGLDARFYGEEERDLYVRIKALGLEVWYLHQLMASHYDLKNKSFKRNFFSDSSAVIWIPLIKSIKTKNISSYLFVYRATLIPFVIDILTIILFLLMGNGSFIPAIFLQSLEFMYCKIINRKGYFIIWKLAIINIFRLKKIYNRKVSFTVEKQS
jgi:glycosyltransferase involved in cell wall biosynthesis